MFRKKAIFAVGKPYVKEKEGKTLQQRLEEAVAPRNKNRQRQFFRDTWYPETRKGILDQEDMYWLYDIIYTPLCSAVHSDSAASKILGGLKKDSMVTWALQFWSAGMYRFVETFNIRLPAQYKGVLRGQYESLQWNGVVA
jgi:hypothetical protein